MRYTETTGDFSRKFSLEREWTRLLNVPAAPMAGVVELPWRKLIKVYERRMVGGELWYYVKAIQLETLNP